MSTEKQCADHAIMAAPHDVEVYLAVAACYKQLDESSGNKSKCLILFGNVKVSMTQTSLINFRLKQTNVYKC